MDDPLKLTAYVVQKRFKAGALTLKIMDANGNQVLKSEGRLLVTRQPLQTMDGKVISTITRKIMAMSPEYDIHAGDAKGEVTGIVKEPMQLFSSVNLNIEIKDASGNALAAASGNFLNMEVDITDSSGNVAAKITRKLDANGILGKLTQLATDSYAIQIVGNSLPPQKVLEFMITLELMLSRNQSSNPGVFTGVPGFGGMRL